MTAVLQLVWAPCWDYSGPALLSADDFFSLHQHSCDDPALWCLQMTIDYCGGDIDLPACCLQMTTVSQPAWTSSSLPCNRTWMVSHLRRKLRRCLQVRQHPWPMLARRTLTAILQTLKQFVLTQTAQGHDPTPMLATSVSVHSSMNSSSSKRRHRAVSLGLLRVQGVMGNLGRRQERSQEVGRHLSHSQSVSSALSAFYLQCYMYWMKDCEVGCLIT